LSSTCAISDTNVVDIYMLCVVSCGELGTVSNGNHFLPDFQTSYYERICLKKVFLDLQQFH